jgi:hypothetical protein
MKLKKFLLLKTNEEEDNFIYSNFRNQKNNKISVFFLFTERYNYFDQLFSKNNDYIYKLSDDQYYFLKKNYSISKVHFLTKKEFFIKVKMEEFLI